LRVIGAWCPIAREPEFQPDPEERHEFRIA